jgi:hypothetical protein
MPAGSGRTPSPRNDPPFRRVAGSTADARSQNLHSLPNERKTNMLTLTARRTLSALPALLIAAALSLPAPSSVHARVAEDTDNCGGFDSPLCKQTEACAGWFWARICTTTYFYWPRCISCQGEPIFAAVVPIRVNRFA